MKRQKKIRGRMSKGPVFMCTLFLEKQLSRYSRGLWPKYEYAAMRTCYRLMQPAGRINLRARTAGRPEGIRFVPVNVWTNANNAFYCCRGIRGTSTFISFTMP